MKKFILLVFLTLSYFFNSFSQHVKLENIWHTDTILFAPESAVYDSIRGYIYISNVSFTAEDEKNITLYNECISKLDLNGNVVCLRWIDSLLGPTGITIYNDKLFAIERGFLTEINIDSRKIVKRYPIPDFGFPNDLAFDKAGSAFITDSERNWIYKFDGTKVVKWFTDTSFHGLNCLYLTGDTLLVGNSGQNCLLALNVIHKTVTIKTRNAVNFVDGIAPYQSDFIIGGETKIKWMDKMGNTEELIDSKNNKVWYADFFYIPQKNLLIVPALFSNIVFAFGITEN